MVKTKIEWTNVVWNPVTGCTKISAGCKNCYAERIAKRFWGERKFADIKLHPDRLEQPLRWRKPRMVFVNSMSDLFHEALTDEEIASVFGVMASAQGHTFQVLTKRVDRLRRWGEWIEQNRRRLSPAGFCATLAHDCIGPFGFSGQSWPLPNVWLGVSCSTQQDADEMIPILLDTPAAVRFVSLEPLLDPVELDADWLMKRCSGCNCHEPCPHDCNMDLMESPRIDWAIVGGESGPGARPMHPNWVRSIRDQCIIAGVPLFFKQMIIDDTLVKMPELDGRQWDQMPD